MSEEKGLNPVILDIAALSAAVAARCPSGTAEMIGRLAERGVPDHQIRETVDLARTVAGESWERASGMIDAVLEGEPLDSCMSRAMRGSGGEQGGCCGETSEKSSCC
ncbi:MAG: hypothetical protein ACQER6_00565 [Pseudomonadota bacterium]